jgi:hypothetical protein
MQAVSSGGLLWIRQWDFEIHEVPEISSPAEWQPSFQGLWYVELVF